LNTDRLSARLSSVASFVEDGAILADIGSDHAYLPCFLIKTGKIQKAIAGEVAKGPYDSAKNNISREGFSDFITIRLADGLFAIEQSDEVTTVTIAGMGGPLISSILENGKERLQNIKRIIVQPNIHSKAIREWAVLNGWKIMNEEIMKEDGKIYEIIVLEKGHATYDESDLLTGPILKKERNAVFIEKWERELAEWQRVLESIENVENTEAIITKREQLAQQISVVRKVLAI
jgi:tRNA (adenine22-N1)-methyltransferase